MPGAARAAKAPFPKSARRVAGLLQPFREGHGFIGDRQLSLWFIWTPSSHLLVSADKRVPRVEAGHQYTSRTGTHWTTAVVLRKFHPLTRELIDSRGAYFRLAVAPQFVVTEVVRQNQNDVGRLWFFSAGLRRQPRHHGDQNQKQTSGGRVDHEVGHRVQRLYKQWSLKTVVRVWASQNGRSG